jgi:hypothetical protein
VNGSISPRVVALSLGVAAAAGLFAGGAGLTTRGTSDGGSTPAPTSASPDHVKSKQHTSSATAGAGGGGALTTRSAGSKVDKPGHKRPKKPAEQSLPEATGSPTPQSSLTPSPSASAPVSSEPSTPSTPAVTTEAAAGSPGVGFG